MPWTLAIVIVLSLIVLVISIQASNHPDNVEENFLDPLPNARQAGYWLVAWMGSEAIREEDRYDGYAVCWSIRLPSGGFLLAQRFLPDLSMQMPIERCRSQAVSLADKLNRKRLVPRLPVFLNKLLGFRRV